MTNLSRDKLASRNVAELQAQILMALGIDALSSMRVLDIGCGNGSTVNGWLEIGANAYGCDFRFKEGKHVASLQQQNRLSIIPNTHYRLPYPDERFDLVLTNQVMEHVIDYPSTLSEIQRILKPGGYCLHIFPSRWMPIEPHVFVPFATVLRSYWWLSLWAFIGIRKRSQREQTWRDVAWENQQYLLTSTNYLTGKEIEKHFRQFFSKFNYAEKQFLQNSPNKRGQKLARIGEIFPFVFPLYRAIWSRVILTQK